MVVGVSMIVMALWALKSDKLGGAARRLHSNARGLLHRRDRRQDPGGDNSAREQTRFEISVSPCTGRPRRGRPQPIAISREDQSLIQDPSQSFRDLPSATPGRPFRKSGTEGSNPLSSSKESIANSPIHEFHKELADAGLKMEPA